MNIFRLIRALRPVNLIMTVFILVSVRYGILRSEEIDRTWFPLYLIALVFIMAFGYLVNDYFDVETDRINKPGKNIFDIKKQSEPFLFMLLSAAVGLIIPIAGFLKNYHWAGLLLIYAFSLIALYIYAKLLKNTLVWGNLLIAALSGLVILVPGHIKNEHVSLSAGGHTLVSVYSVFALITTFVREIVKDAEDAEGDKSTGIKTLATVLGTGISVYTSTVFMLIGILLLTGMGYHFFQTNSHLAKAVSFWVLAVCGFFPLFKMSRATEKKQFSAVSSLLKLWMLLGIISMWI